MAEENVVTLDDLENMSDEDFNKYADSLDLDITNKGDDTDEKTDKETDNTTEDSTESGEHEATDNALPGGSTDNTEGTKEDSDNQQEVDDKESDEGGDPESTTEAVPFPTGSLDPLKVNGSEVPVGSIDELRELAAKAIEQQAELEELNKNKKYINALTAAGVLNDDDINRLIAINNKDPKAVSALISEIDNIDELPDEEEISGYTPTNVIPEEQELLVESTLSRLAQKPIYDKLISTLQNDLDEPSKRSLYERPEGINTLAEHMETGVFDKVATEVAKQKILGNISASTPFIDAYKIVGTTMYADEGNKEPESGNTTNTSKASKEKKPNTFQQEQSSKGTQVASLTLADLDDMSDEEFLEKVGNLTF